MNSSVPPYLAGGTEMNGGPTMAIFMVFTEDDCISIASLAAGSVAGERANGRVWRREPGRSSGGGDLAGHVAQRELT
jgi:hypothetical protein